MNCGGGGVPYSQGGGPPFPGAAAAAPSPSSFYGGGGRMQFPAMGMMMQPPNMMIMMQPNSTNNNACCGGGGYLPQSACIPATAVGTNDLNLPVAAPQTVGQALASKIEYLEQQMRNAWWYIQYMMGQAQQNFSVDASLMGGDAQQFSESTMQQPASFSAVLPSQEEKNDEEEIMTIVMRVLEEKFEQRDAKLRGEMMRILESSLQEHDSRMCGEFARLHAENKSKDADKLGKRLDEISAKIHSVDGEMLHLQMQLTEKKHKIDVLQKKMDAGSEKLHEEFSSQLQISVEKMGQEHEKLQQYVSSQLQRSIENMGQKHEKLHQEFSSQLQASLEKMAQQMEGVQKKQHADSADNNASCSGGECREEGMRAHFQSLFNAFTNDVIRETSLVEQNVAGFQQHVGLCMQMQGNALNELRGSVHALQLEAVRVQEAHADLRKLVEMLEEGLAKMRAEMMDDDLIESSSGTKPASHPVKGVCWAAAVASSGSSGSSGSNQKSKSSSAIVSSAATVKQVSERVDALDKWVQDALEKIRQQQQQHELGSGSGAAAFAMPKKAAEQLLRDVKGLQGKFAEVQSALDECKGRQVDLGKRLTAVDGKVDNEVRKLNQTVGVMQSIQLPGVSEEVRLLKQYFDESMQTASIAKLDAQIQKSVDAAMQAALMEKASELLGGGGGGGCGGKPASESAASIGPAVQQGNPPSSLSSSSDANNLPIATSTGKQKKGNGGKGGGGGVLTLKDLLDQIQACREELALIPTKQVVATLPDGTTIDQAREDIRKDLFSIQKAVAVIKEMHASKKLQEDVEDLKPRVEHVENLVCAMALRADTLQGKVADTFAENRLIFEAHNRDVCSCIEKNNHMQAKFILSICGLLDDLNNAIGCDASVRIGEEVRSLRGSLDALFKDAKTKKSDDKAAGTKINDDGSKGKCETTVKIGLVSSKRIIEETIAAEAAALEASQPASLFFPPKNSGPRG